VPKYQNFINSKNSRQIYLVLFLIIISFLATIFQLAALKVNLVPILEVFKRAIGILMSLMFGYLVFKEHIGIKKILSIIIIFLGLTFIF
jgi:multidrug transporter EmrE-like cation transporter